MGNFINALKRATNILNKKTNEEKDLEKDLRKLVNFSEISEDVPAEYEAGDVSQTALNNEAGILLKMIFSQIEVLNEEEAGKGDKIIKKFFSNNKNLDALESFSNLIQINGTEEDNKNLDNLKMIVEKDLSSDLINKHLNNGKQI